jgi:(E)-4-hydroxy-3-methylbut-2-enyl-diphosphate synthase
MSDIVNQIRIAGLAIGGNAPVRVESMLKIPLSDEEESLSQCRSLAEEGCELLRVAFPELRFRDAFARFVDASPIPLMADIHFDPLLAIAAMEIGCPSIRINPGNLSSRSLGDLVAAARAHRVVIRVGANSGSVNERQLRNAAGDRAAALAIAVGEQMESLVALGFHDIIVSAKSSSVRETVSCVSLLAQRYPDYPVHIGITEAGPGMGGVVKSSIGIGLLLAQGIGNTIRVSLSEAPEMEVRAGYHILRSLELRKRGVNLISCPTCGRKRLDVRSVLPEIERYFRLLPDGTNVAVMGCEVNGPREAAHADIGIAGSPGGVVVFSLGKRIGECSFSDIPTYIPAVFSSFSEERRRSPEADNP